MIGKPMKYLYGKNVFLTGGSSGIGRATAELFAANGYAVYAASRTPQEDVRVFPGGGEIRPVAVDVCDQASIESAAEKILSQSDIGIIVHCAGVGLACAAEDFPPAAVSWLTETNYLGVLRVNSSFLPHMRKRGGGLCVITGSVAGMFPVPYQSHYCASKAALDLYSRTLRMELRDYGVKVSLLMPGDTKTGFTGSRKYTIEESSPHYEACHKAVRKMEKDEQGGYPPESAARAILKLSAQKKPPAHKIVGIDYKLLVFLSRLLPGKFIEFILRTMYMGRQM